MHRIMYVGHTAKPSGGEIALVRLLSAVRGQVDPLVVLAEDGPLVALLESEGIEVLVLPLSESTREMRKERLRTPAAALAQFLTVAGYALRLRRLIRQRQVDVIHTNTLKAGFYGCIAARLAGVPSVWHVRDRLAEDYLPRLGVLAARLALAVLPTRIICISRATAETVEQGVLATRRSRILVAPVYDVLDVPLSSSSLSPRSESAEFRIGMVGRLSPWKGQDVVVRAVCSLPFSFRLVLVGTAMFGEDEYVEQLHALVEDRGLKGKVEFRGFVDDVLSALREFDVLVHASTVPEPFGQVVVEGMAAGVPVVASRAGGPGEIVTDGVDGLLYEPGDVSGLAERIRALHGDPALAERLVRNGLTRAKDFAPGAVAPAVLAVYDDLVARHERGRA
ncbi:glycosyltransferase family 4 protein [Geodermatophilus sp. SYSU D01036]